MYCIWGPFLLSLKNQPTPNLPEHKEDSLYHLTGQDTERAERAEGATPQNHILRQPSPRPVSDHSSQRGVGWGGGLVETNTYASCRPLPTS